MPSLRTLRHAFALVLLALVSRALVPAGYMPAAMPGGGITFAMCSDGAAAVGWLDADGNFHKQGDDDRGDGEQNCTFAGAAATTLFAHDPQPPFRPALVAAAISHSETATPGPGLAAPPPPATGPPVLI